MKTIVIYKSETGFTKKYAKWIGEELSGDIFDVSQANIDTLKNYDTIIYGGGLYASGINNIKFITENFNDLRDKRVIVFATGLSIGRDEEIQDVKNKNFTYKQQEHIKFFYFRGGFDYKRLSIFNKILMTLLKWKLKSKKELTSDEQGMLSVYDKPVDYSKKENIDELINYVIS